MESQPSHLLALQLWANNLPLASVSLSAEFRSAPGLVRVCDHSQAQKRTIPFLAGSCSPNALVNPTNFLGTFITFWGHRPGQAPGAPPVGVPGLGAEVMCLLSLLD